MTEVEAVAILEKKLGEIRTHQYSQNISVKDLTDYLSEKWKIELVQQKIGKLLDAYDWSRRGYRLKQAPTADDTENGLRKELVKQCGYFVDYLAAIGCPLYLREDTCKLIQSPEICPYSEFSETSVKQIPSHFKKHEIHQVRGKGDGIGRLRIYERRS